MQVLHNHTNVNPDNIDLSPMTECGFCPLSEMCDGIENEQSCWHVKYKKGETICENGSSCSTPRLV